jgi:flagellin-like hook-associated protein FlgL
MVQATQTVTRQQEILGVLQTEDAPDVITGYNPRQITEDRPPNWHYFEENVDFGNSFTIYEGYNAPDLINGGTVTGDPTTAVTVPTPSEAQMINPGYEDYVVTATLPDGTETTTTRSASNDIKLHHDDHTVASLASGGNDLEISVETVGGDKELKLDTGFIKFQDEDRFGIFHGPATVSDEFISEAGDFLKFDYDARIVDDNFHVAGYIYNVATNEITMALNKTDSYGAGTASIEVTEDATYRFVFVVGTYDLTGGMEAGSNMKIDNVRAEDAYDIEQDAIDELLKALHYSNQSASAAPTKTLSTSLLENGTENVLIADLSEINITGVSGQPAGPFRELGGLNLVTVPEDAISENDAHILTSKIETVQERLNIARVTASSQLTAISSAIDSSTDLKSQFSMGSGTLTDLNFSSESAYLARRQIQHDIATAMLAQANLGQTHLISLLTL